jgi:hypothetical protein
MNGVPIWRALCPSRARRTSQQRSMRVRNGTELVAVTIPRVHDRQRSGCDVAVHEDGVCSAWNSASIGPRCSPSSTWVRRMPTVPSRSTKKLVP